MTKFDPVTSLFNQVNLKQNKVESIDFIDSTSGLILDRSLKWLRSF